MEKELLTGIKTSTNAWTPQAQELLPTALLEVLGKIHREMNPTRLELLKQRKMRQENFDKGQLPQFDKTSKAHTSDWKVAPIPKDLQTRRVEITGPINDPKMVINMLSRNSQGHKADTAMLDFEDSMMPNWNNVLSGVQNIKAVALGNLEFTSQQQAGAQSKTYRLNADDMAMPMVRIRGLHLAESNITIDGTPISAGLFDLVATAFHASTEFIKRGITPKFYVPKCEHPQEAKWWNEIFQKTEASLGIKASTLRCTFLIETLPAAFAIEEILYELKERIVGLNVGRWDKIFSDIKVLRAHKDRLSCDRALITMKSFWMDHYAKRLIKICHRRGAYAIGGMSAFTPGKEAQVRQEQTKKVFEDKKREFTLGHDGCWVSHPYFVSVALEAFTANSQLHIKLDDFDEFSDLLMKGSTQEERTLQGLQTNIRVGIAYMQGWNQGIGCVAWDNLMEDLATLEISRAQTWQWLHHRASLKEGQTVTKELVTDLFDQELKKIEKELLATNPQWEEGDKKKTLQTFRQAKEDACRIFTNDSLQEFLSLSSQEA